MSGTQPPDIRNERIKLTAAYLNAAAGSSLAIGVLIPVAAAFFYNAAPAGLRLWWIAVSVAIWFTTSVVLHFLARWNPQEPAMNDIQLFAFVIMPVLVMALGAGVAGWALWSARHR